MRSATRSPTPILIGSRHICTRLLHGGMDLKTVRKLLGHKNLESTMRYLSRAESSKVKAKVDAIWAGK